MRRGDVQTAVHLSDAIDGDRLNQHVNGYRVEVVEPLQKLRIVMDETEGVACDLTWDGLFGVVQEQRHLMRQGTGSPSMPSASPNSVPGWTTRHRRREDRRRPGDLDRHPRPVLGHPSGWRGRAAGTPTRRSRACGGSTSRWPSDDFAIVIIIQEDPSGFRSLNDCTRIWRDGHVEQLGSHG